jgi:hypothetical protein
MGKGIYIRTDAIKKSLSIAAKNTKDKHIKCEKCGIFKGENHVCPTKEEIENRILKLRSPEVIIKRTNVQNEMRKLGKIKPYWNGKKRDNETRRKIIETKKMLYRLGLHKISSMIQRAKPGVRLNTGRTLFKKGQYAGSKHLNWKGGLSKAKHELWSNKEYQIWRKAVFERDKYICQKCGCDGKVKTLNAHHLKDKYRYPDIMFDINNGLTLCVDCHIKLHRLNWINNRK